MKLILIILTACASLCLADPPLTITLIHLNDLHGKYEPVTAGSKSEECKQDPKQACIGGYARVVHAVRALKDKYRDFNPIHINAGDNFQGSVWYGFLRWNVTQAMLNLEPPSMMTLGNHEFDHGIDNLAQFLNNVKWPVICANIKTRDEPAIDEKISGALVKQFHVNSQLVKVGFIGALFDKTNLTTNTGKVQFLNAIGSVRREAENLRDAGINKIIVVSHCGHSVDLEIAEAVGDLVDVIVGSHSHTLLWPKHHNTHPTDQTIMGEYPTIVYPRIAPGRKVLLVQAFCHGKVVGALKLDFDSNGEVIKYESDPLYLDENYPQDAEVNKVMDVWRNEIVEIGKTQIGHTKVLLGGKNCRWGECPVGNLFITIFRKHYFKDWSEPMLALLQGVSFKGDITNAIITDGDLMRVFPFDSSVDAMDLEGKHIRRSLEKAACLDRKQRFNFFQTAGFKVIYDMKRNEYERVVDVKVDLGNKKFEPLMDEKIYKVVTTSFIANGGDNFTEISLNKKNYQMGPDSRDTIKNYLATHTITGSDLDRGSFVLNCPYCEDKKVK
uniref:apyrase n=1 Tax=Culicoides obsoletus TaxID=289301 RepID=A0A7U3MHU0_CULOB|nr:allergen Cul o 15 [Culicoides obsoletus]